MDTYIGFAQMYDELMENVPYEKWGRYIGDTLGKQLASQSPLVVDLACGTGTMALLLASQGFDMIGVDMSMDMLAEAQQKAYEAAHNILFLAQDMRKLDLFGTVDAMVSVCDGMNYMLDPADLLTVFKRVRLFLNPGGVFIFDMNTEYKFKYLLGQQSFETKTKSGAAYDLDNHYNEATKINEYRVLFHPSPGAGESFTETHRQRAYEVAEVVQMLQSAGFTQVAAYHDYTHEPPRADSPRVTFVAACDV